MNLLSSLEKFGLTSSEELDITKDPNQTEEKKKKEPEKNLEEKDYLVKRHVKCPVCDHRFDSLTVRSSMTRRLDSDFDLRPRYSHVDKLKYDVTLCPNCGYAALNRTFEPLTDAQVGRLTTHIRSKFHPMPNEHKETYTYNEAIDRYKLALVSAMVKYAKISEKSVLCLRVAWLLRDQINLVIKQLPEEVGGPMENAARAEMDGFYRQAYEGFLQAIQKETPPYCGINGNSWVFIMTNMAIYFEDYAVASKYLYEMIGNKSTPEKLRNRYLDLKYQLVDVKREEERARRKKKKK